MRVKVFAGEARELERDINDFLDKNTLIKIIETKYITIELKSFGYITVFVWYE